MRRAICLAGASLLAASLTACGDSRSGADAGSGSGADKDSGAWSVDTSACPAGATQPLAEGEPIKIGVSTPLSGPLASAGLQTVGMKAYFERVKAEGGIDGHQIELIAKDDAFDAARSVSNAQAFTGQDKVFATLAQVGTPSIEATRPIYEAACTPQLWVISTSAKFADPENHPWTTLGIPPVAVEAQAAVDYISKAKPGASVAELVGADDLGNDMHAAFPGLAKQAGLKVLPSQSLAAGATSVDSQVSAMLAAKPDAVVLETLPNYCGGFLTSLARANYDGIVFVNSSCNGAAQWITPVDPAGDGVVTPMFRKDPADSRYAGDAAMKQYRQDMKKVGGAGSAGIGNALDGYNFGALVVRNLRDAAAMDGGLTRANLMTAAWHTKVERPLSLKPEQAMNGPEDPFIVEAGELHQYVAERKGWRTTDVTFDLEGKTGTLVP